MLDLPERQLKIVCDILQEIVPDREVWAFGSRIRGTARSYSDLDIVVMGDAALAVCTVNRLVEAFEVSELPIRVDVLDWCTLSSGFQSIIQQAHVVVKQIS